MTHCGPSGSEVSSIRSRKFRPINDFQTDINFYHLLPFRFHKITDQTEVLINEIGDFLLCDIGTARRIVNREVSYSDRIYADLISQFFISEKPIPDLIDLMATRYRTKKAFLDEFTSLHIFVMTLRCNHKCRYCQVSRVAENCSDFDMSLSNIDKSVELMFMSPSKNLTVEFQGGEPLLAYDKIKYAVEMITRLNEIHKRRVTFVLCTNLSIMSEDMLDFCKKFGVIISTSLDGPEYLHNSNRPMLPGNGFRLIKDNIRLCQEILGGDSVSALMTTSELSLKYPREIVDEYIAQGFTSVFLRPINPYGLAKKHRDYDLDYLEQFLSFYKTALLYIIEVNKQGITFIEDYASIILSKMLTPFAIGFTDLQSPSGVINSVVVYNYDGAVYASDESRMLAEEGDYTFRLGHVSSDEYQHIFYGPKAQWISQHWANEALPGCSECAFLPFCGADPVRNYATHGDIVGHRPTSGFCKKNIEIIRFLFQLISESNETEMLFRSWVNNTHSPAQPGRVSLDFPPC